MQSRDNVGIPVLTRRESKQGIFFEHLNFFIADKRKKMHIHGMASNINWLSVFAYSHNWLSKHSSLKYVNMSSGKTYESFLANS